MHSLDDTRARCIIPLPDCLPPNSALFTARPWHIITLRILRVCQCTRSATSTRVPGGHGRDQKVARDLISADELASSPYLARKLSEILPPS